MILKSSSSAFNHKNYPPIPPSSQAQSPNHRAQNQHTHFKMQQIETPINNNAINRTSPLSNGKKIVCTNNHHIANSSSKANLCNKKPKAITSCTRSMLDKPNTTPPCTTKTIQDPIRPIRAHHRDILTYNPTYTSSASSSYNSYTLDIFNNNINFNIMPSDNFKSETRFIEFIEQSKSTERKNIINNFLSTVSQFNSKYKQGRFNTSVPAFPSSNELELLYELVALLDTATEHKLYTSIQKYLPKTTRINILDVLHRTKHAVSSNALLILGSGDIRQYSDNIKSTNKEFLDLENKVEKFKNYLINPDSNIGIFSFIKRIAADKKIKSNEQREVIIKSKLITLLEEFNKIFEINNDMNPPLIDPFNIENLGGTKKGDCTIYPLADRYLVNDIRLDIDLLNRFIDKSVSAGIELFTTYSHELIHRFQNIKCYQFKNESTNCSHYQYGLLQSAADYANSTRKKMSLSKSEENYLYRANEREREAYAAERYWTEALYDAFESSLETSFNSSKKIPNKVQIAHVDGLSSDGKMIKSQKRYATLQWKYTLPTSFFSNKEKLVLGSL